MSASTNRKNGKQASCEPCRRGKVRCDHRMPICDRCRRRNMDTECFYHPAPLTRPSKRPRMSSPEYNRSESIGTTQQIAPVAAISYHNDDRVDSGVSENSLSTHLLPVRNPDATSPGDLPLLSLQSLDNSNAQHEIDIALYDDRGDKTLEGDLLSIIYILEHLKYCGIIRKLVSAYYELGQVAVIPSQLVLPAISDLEQIHRDILHLRTTTDDATSNAAIRAVAGRIRRATASKIVVTRTTSLNDFRSSYTGINLRVETVGLIFTLAARASRIGLSLDKEDRHEFVQAMFQCSARCMHLARELATEMNDVIVWLSYENLRISTSIQGYATHHTPSLWTSNLIHVYTDPCIWRRLGNVSTDLLALEAHREAATTNVPFFLAECRRRTFAAAYHWDKFLATLFDRPPRILSCFADCHLPFEMADDRLCLTGSSDEEQALYERTGGWSTGNSFCSTTWIRALYILAQFKEEALLHHLKPLDHETRSKLEMIRVRDEKCRSDYIHRDLASRCQRTWDNFPKRLHYDSACWKSDLTLMTSLRLAEVYLTYLQTRFHIHRLMEKGDSRCSPELVRICSSIIETTVEIGSFRNQAVYQLHRSFRASTVGRTELVMCCIRLTPCKVLCYGLPSAVTLVNALKSARKTMSRVQFADLVHLVSIRRLSVFVSLLESVYRPEDANYTLCMKASKLISSALDEVLDYLLSVFADGAQELAPSLTSNSTAEVQNPTSSDDVAAFWLAGNTLGELMDWDAANLVDMNNWMEGIDWTNASAAV
ncbi:hypothetical protein E4T48_07707 [Aureobasidium sp. EXF-10727]|nr:hypothetical protein E4T48_07707 [Aureobasidium sp. EXF-10727]